MFVMCVETARVFLYNKLNVHVLTDISNYL